MRPASRDVRFAVKGNAVTVYRFQGCQAQNIFVLQKRYSEPDPRRSIDHRRSSIAIGWFTSHPRLSRCCDGTACGHDHCAAAFTRALTRNQELDWFKAKYGPSSYSQYGEEWLIRDFFQDQRGGFFVDVGSYDYKQYSNTYYLEQVLGWSGVAIDAQQEFEDDYVKYRPRTRFFAAFVSERSGAVESLFVPERTRAVASSVRSSPIDTCPRGSTKSAPISLNDLLQRVGVSRIDFLSMA